MVFQVQQGRNRPMLSLPQQTTQPFIGDGLSGWGQQNPPGMSPPYVAPRDGVDGPAEPFTWSPDGKRRTAGDMEIARLLAQKQIAAGTDTSPVGHWTQGLHRVAQALLGGLEMRQIEKDTAANAAHSQEVMGGLTPTTGQPTLEAAMRAATDPYASPEVRQMGQFWMERLAPKPSTAQPYRFEDNAGNQWELGADGQPKMFFTDRAPKQMVANGQLITSTNPYIGGAPPAAPAAGPQPGAIVDDPRLATPGGAGPQAPRPFP